MLSNMNIDPQTTTLDPIVVEQLQALWEVPAYIPLAGSLERFSAFVMHITVTILILQMFTRKKAFWLWAGVGLELLANGTTIALSEANVMLVWVALVSLFFLAGNLFILYKLNAFEFDITRAGGKVSIKEPPEDVDK